MRKRIAMISEHASPLGVIGGVDSGGQNVYVAQLARHLGKAGYQVDVFTRRDDAHLPETVEWADGVRVIHVPAGPARFVRKEEMLPYMSEFADRLVRFLEREVQPYGLVHANFWMSGLAAAEVKKALYIPFVVTFHALGRVRRLYQGDADQFPDARFAIEDRVIAEADGIIAECPQDQQDLIELYEANPAKITMIPAGFDPEELYPVDKERARRELGLSPDERIVLQLGRLVPRKGIETVIRGMSRLVIGRGIAARLLIVGGDSERPDPHITPEIGRLQRIAAEEKIADHVTFVGRRSRPALKNYYSLADVFVTAPWYEPFGMTPLEAMGCGTPVIGSRVGGIKYSVVHGETGYLIPPQDPEALAAHLGMLFDNPERLARFGDQALVRAREHFTWPMVAERMASLYEETMIRGASRRARSNRGQAIIKESFEQAVEALRRSHQDLQTHILAAAEAISECLQQGGKLLVCGNGGSAADAQHFAGELVGRFERPNRRALPALALTADTAVLTAWANDVGYDKVFARQVEAFGHPGDILIGISTSGRSRNVVEAFEAAARLGLERIAILGGDGGDLISVSDIAMVVPSSRTARIQEVHLVILHLLCQLVEAQLGTLQKARTAEPIVEPFAAGEDKA